MRGSITVPFSELFADTVNTHGIQWAKEYYLKNGMQLWEFNFWAFSMKLEDIKLI